MALLAGREILRMMASGIAPLHVYGLEVNRPRCRQGIKRMRLMAFRAFGNVGLFFRIVRHISMRIDLFPARRHVISGIFDDFVEGAVATEALAL